MNLKLGMRRDLDRDRQLSYQCVHLYFVEVGIFCEIVLRWSDGYVQGHASAGFRVESEHLA